MDAIDRMYRTLVQTLRGNFPQYLTQPFEVAELYSTILPYRHHRRSLGFETNQDYEVALLELLSGARGYLLVDDRMRDALTRELASPNPDPGAFRQFAQSQVSLAHEPLRQMQETLDAETPASLRALGATGPTGAIPALDFTTATPAQRPSSAASAAGDVSPAARTTSIDSPPQAAPAPRASAGVAAPRTTPAAGSDATAAPSERGIVVGPNEDCRFCGGILPAGRRLVFCPHCGQDLTVQHCLACGTELELGWRFCISCGRATGS